jgi:CxxC-x17-CxxC domain-containing protein
MAFNKGKKKRMDYRPDSVARRNDTGISRFSDNKNLTKTTCDDCGRICSVPFKPNASKPVYCNDCYRKDDSAPRGTSKPSSNQDLAQINAKLDRILKILDA